MTRVCDYGRTKLHLDSDEIQASCLLTSSRLIQFEIVSLSGHELAMRALLDDLARGHNNDDVRSFHSIQSLEENTGSQHRLHLFSMRKPLHLHE